MTYLTNHQIAQLAENALNNDEVACSWSGAYRSIEDDCLELYGFHPRKSLVLMALKMAQAGWGEIVIQTKKIIQAQS